MSIEMHTGDWGKGVWKQDPPTNITKKLVNKNTIKLKTFFPLLRKTYQNLLDPSTGNFKPVCSCLSSFFHLSVLSFCLFFFFCLSICLSWLLSVFISVCQTVYLVFCLFLFLSISLSVLSFVCFLFWLSTCQSTDLITVYIFG